jgi:hypothetical protein
MYLAVPSYNPDPRIRLPIPVEHVINGERVFEKQVKQKTLNTLYELGLYDSERGPARSYSMGSFVEVMTSLIKC